MLGLWSGMSFDADGDVLSDVGCFEIFDWRPHKEELSPLDYDWRLPTKKRLWPAQPET